MYDDDDDDDDDDDYEYDEDEEDAGDGVKLIGKSDGDHLEEKALKTGLEILFPFLAGGLGMVLAGTVLNVVQVGG